MTQRVLVVPALVLVLGLAVVWFNHRTQRPLSHPAAVADAGTPRTAASTAADSEPAAFLDDDPWLPGVPGYKDPFDRPLRGPSLDELTRDIGVDIRGIGDGKPGSLVNLDDVSNGLDDVFAGSPRNPLDSFDASQGATARDTGIYYNDGKDGDFRGRTENSFDIQWKSIMANVDDSMLPQVATVRVPSNWLDDVATRGPGTMKSWRSRRFWERITSPRRRGDWVEDARGPLFGGEEEEAIREALRGDRTSTIAEHATRQTAVANVRIDGMRSKISELIDAGQEHIVEGRFAEALESFEDARFIIRASPFEVEWGTLEKSVAGGLRTARYAMVEEANLERRRAVEEALAELTAEEEARLLTEVERRERLLDPTFQARERKRAKDTRTKRTWRRARATPNNVRLMVGDKDELPLESMDIAVRIDGFRARVVIDAWFLNVYDRNLNGSFQVRLPTGASPHHLAFGKTALKRPIFQPPTGSTMASIRAERDATWEAPKEARMVSREQAAHAYTETVREGIDPALMEWAGAGVFAAQVFPLEPRSMHRIVLAYDIDLHVKEGALVHVLDLPQDVPHLDVAITTDRTIRHRNPRQERFVTTVRASKPTVLTGESSQAGALFATQITPPLPRTETSTAERAVFLVDTSASSDPDRFNTWLALLRALLEKNREGIREFAVGFFSVDTHWWQDGFVVNNQANVDRLLKDAHQRSLEGATDLGQALGTADALPGAFDVFLLSDGGATWGETHPHAIAARLDASHACFGYVVPGGMADPAMLAVLARRSGGAVFPLLAESEANKVATAHSARPWRLEGVSIDGTSDLLLAGAPTTLFPGQTLRIAGRGTPKQGARVELRVRQGEITRTVTVPLGAPRASPLATRAYGEIAVQQLEGLGGAAADEARAYASHFRVVGSSCSLLMLETEADYMRRRVSAEDERAVRTAPASELVATHVAEARELLADPKARFLARLDRWAALPGQYRLSVPPALHRALQTLPVEAFALRHAPLKRTTRRRIEVAGSVRTLVGKSALTYEIAMAEAARRRARHGEDDALAFLSTLVEQSPGDLVLARDLALTAQASGHTTIARDLLLRVGTARPWQRMTWLAVGRCLAQAGQDALALPFFEAAIDVEGSGRAALTRVAALDYEPVLYRVALREDDDALRRFARTRLRKIAALANIEEADLIVILEWNTDRTDVDLHVTDPTGEECYYEHRTTAMGGSMSEDIRSGFGPEIFVLPKAAKGRYTIEAKYFSGDGVRTQARSKVYARIIEDFGGSNERERRATVVLGQHGDRTLILGIERDTP